MYTNDFFFLKMSKFLKNIIIEEGTMTEKNSRPWRYFLIDKIVITTNHRSPQFTLLRSLPFSNHLHYLLFNPFLSRGSINSACFSAIKFLPLLDEFYFWPRFSLVHLFSFFFFFVYFREKRIFWTFFQ